LRPALIEDARGRIHGRSVTDPLGLH